ncbi:hypothetical protein SmJEL517_g03624 [Synchytrium microbalum]|uniref:Selenoprotein O n=1 Tax=Synchytrium microbalum TaxID=1806994 RepID=A0A507C2E2_9FUNG|nr:uncharacterized protein SmJEL517_g03624 [Synchytrium microbalum]TPX33528.1 hypothetical protein SmJEL517_g03624 [Synchytrium microbalum]
MLKNRITELNFVNTFTNELKPDVATPGLPTVKPTSFPAIAHIQRQVKNAHYSYCEPEPTPGAFLIAASESSARLLDLDLRAILANPQAKQEFIDVNCGNTLLEGTNPWAHVYAGYQFGFFAGQLGDGRAISLGELVNSRGETWEIQLKGAGKTPYSRFADGYAVIREYLASEAMHYLGIPTSRALALTGSTRDVYRETEEKGAVVSRIAPSWIRFGSFELPYSRGDKDTLRVLADYVIRHHYPECEHGEDAVDGGKYVRLVDQVGKRTAKMVALWQTVGFCHGVMNTDNFSILGLTIDYGPYQFMDAFEPAYICNHTDEDGRYAYNEQPGVAFWNMSRLASAISGLVVEDLGGDTKKAEEVLLAVLNPFKGLLEEEYLTVMRKKLGLLTSKDDDLTTIVQPLLSIMADTRADYTHFLRTLSTIPFLKSNIFPSVSFNEASPSGTVDIPMAPPFESRSTPSELGLLAHSETNPFVVLHRTNNNIFPDIPESPAVVARFIQWGNLYIDRLKSEMGGASASECDAERMKRMKQMNPKYVVRNHLAQAVIEEAEKGSFESFNGYMKVLERPFEEGSEEEQRKWGGNVPANMQGLRCSCSS